MARDIGDALDRHSERIDDAVEKIDSALVDTRAGSEAVQRAASLQAAARRKMCLILIIVAVILGVIAGPVIAKAAGAF
jgi:t-SNARE complex subunit (syntaxin)